VLIAIDIAVGKIMRAKLMLLPDADRSASILATQYTYSQKF